VSINTYPILRDSITKVLYDEVQRTGQYQMQAEELWPFCDQTVILLEDLVIDTLVPFRDGDFYQFHSTASGPPCYSGGTFNCPVRFLVHFIPGSGSIDLGPDTTLCPDDTLALHAGPPAGSYYWHDSSTASFFSATQAGTYHVWATDTHHCISTDTITLHEPDTLKAQFAFIDTAGQVAFFNQSTGASAYAWDFGDGQTSIAFSPVHAYSDTGRYPVCLTASGLLAACGDESGSAAAPAAPADVSESAPSGAGASDGAASAGEVIRLRHVEPSSA